LRRALPSVEHFVFCHPDSSLLNTAVFCKSVIYLSTKYGWIYIKQAQNDNLTIYYRISGGNTRC
jgi:hypothetical protein